MTMSRTTSGCAPVKPAKPRRDNILRRHAQRVDAQRSRGPARGSNRLGDGGIHLQDHRSDALVEAGSRRRRRDAPCRAVEQPHAEPGFELANGLAQGRGGQPEMIGGAREACPLDDGRKGLQLGKFRPAHRLCMIC